MLVIHVLAESGAMYAWPFRRANLHSGVSVAPIFGAAGNGCLEGTKDRAKNRKGGRYTPLRGPCFLPKEAKSQAPDKVAPLDAWRVA